MHDQPTLVADRPETAQTLGPVTAGPSWFEVEDRPYRLLIDVPLAIDLMVAALYDMLGHNPRDLATAESVRGFIAVAVAVDGLAALERRAEELDEPGAVEMPAWLAFCRQRVTEVMGAAA